MSFVFSNLDAVVKMRLLIYYCYSLYGSVCYGICLMLMSSGSAVDLRVGSIKSTQVDLGLPSRVKSV